MLNLAPTYDSARGKPPPNDCRSFWLFKGHACADRFSVYGLERREHGWFNMSTGEEGAVSRRAAPPPPAAAAAHAHAHAR